MASRSYFVQKVWWVDGRVDGWMDGWKGGWKDGKAGLRIAYSNQKVNQKKDIKSGASR